MNILRKIFPKYFKCFEQQINELKEENKSLRKELSDTKDIILEKENTICCLKEENCKLKNENEILIKYYNLDEEPSDEIKTKIHIDLEINKLKEEKMQILMLANRFLIMQPYPACYLTFRK